MTNFPVLSCLKGEFGRREFQIDLKRLYTQIHKLEAFHSRWDEFIKSDSTMRDVCYIEGDNLKYMTESFVSPKVDQRTPLLIMLGNPASHSVASGICFAYEGKNKEHRFWKALREFSILKFPSDNLLSNFDTNRDAVIEERRAS